jgi:hypothetical protein
MIALDPNKTTWIQLPEHKGKPDAPEFQVRFATCRQLDEYFDLLELGKKSEDSREGSKAVTKALEMFLIGWRNMPPGAGDFGPGKIDTVLTWLEKWQLAWLYPGETSAAESEIKKSGSQPPSAGAVSAATAPADAK